MSLPSPAPGLVIRYSYLWRREADRGEDAGRKLRPCAIILAVRPVGDDIVVYVAPITHSSPGESWAGLALTSPIKRRLRLDDEPSWIVTTEFNAFIWPGSDLAALPDEIDATDYVFGALPEAATTRLLNLFRENTRLGRVRVVKRTQ